MILDKRFRPLYLKMKYRKEILRLFRKLLIMHVLPI